MLKVTQPGGSRARTGTQSPCASCQATDEEDIPEWPPGRKEGGVTRTRENN